MNDVVNISNKHLPLPKLHYVKGFSIIELTVVVVILAIIIATGIPIFILNKMHANETKSLAYLQEMVRASNEYFTEHRKYETKWPEGYGYAGIYGGTPPYLPLNTLEK